MRTHEVAIILIMVVWTFILVGIGWVLGSETRFDWVTEKIRTLWPR